MTAGVPTARRGKDEEGEWKENAVEGEEADGGVVVSAAPRFHLSRASVSLLGGVSSFFIIGRRRTPPPPTERLLFWRRKYVLQFSQHSWPSRSMISFALPQRTASGGGVVKTYLSSSTTVVVREMGAGRTDAKPPAPFAFSFDEGK